VRPATFAFADTGQPQKAEIQFQPKGGGSYTVLRTVTITRNCYFDVHVRPPSSGTVRLAWQYPAGDPLLGDFPAPNPAPSPSSGTSGTGTTDGGTDTDPLLGSSDDPSIVHSRTVQVTIK
jgi:hypothetical protein